MTQYHCFDFESFVTNSKPIPPLEKVSFNGIIYYIYKID